MEIETSQKFLPLQIATKYYQEWDCETQLNTANNLYYKSLHGNATIELSNGNKYEGMIENGLFNGKGKYLWKNGLIYEGDFHRNSLTGIGSFKWKNGSVYEGEVLNGYRHGKGTFTSTQDGAEYVGDWIMGKYQGKGKIIYENQGCYEGEFKKNKKHGKGTMTYASKNQYEGNWVEDKKEGRGIMNWSKENEKYEGNWLNNAPHGYGEYYWYENKTEYKILKTIYKGNWVNGKREGFGVFFYSNGCRFEGYFKNNGKDGYGLSVDYYGKEKLDIYKNDRLISLAKKQNIQYTIKKKKVDKQKEREKEKTEIEKLPKIKKNTKISETQYSTEKQIVVNYFQSPTQNEYKNYLDFEHPEINENFFNFLLRENSHLRSIYKLLCLSSTQVKEFYTGLMLENYWKVIKDLKILNQKNTICLINREFAKGYKNEFQLSMPNQNILQILIKNSQLLNKYHYSEIQWQQYVQKLMQAKFEWDSWNFQFPQKIYAPKKLNDMHNPQKIILYRHFVCLVIHTADICEDLGPNLRKRTENLINQLKIYTEGSARNQKSTMNLDFQTQNTKAVFVPEWAKPLNERLIAQINKGKNQLQGKKDETIEVRKLYTILEANHILKDNTEKIMFLEKIERSLNIKISLMRRDMKQYFQIYEGLVKRSPYFNHIMNYEMIQKEMCEILYQAINRKMTCTSQQDLMEKYEEIINKLISFIEENREEEKQRRITLKRKKTKTVKDRQKEELIRRTEEEKVRLEEAKRKKEEEEKEEKQRFKMSLEDKDVEDYFDESDESDQYLF